MFLFFLVLLKKLIMSVWLLFGFGAKKLWSCHLLNQSVFILFHSVAVFPLSKKLETVEAPQPIELLSDDEPLDAPSAVVDMEKPPCFLLSGIMQTVSPMFSMSLKEWSQWGGGAKVTKLIAKDGGKQTEKELKKIFVLFFFFQSNNLFSLVTNLFNHGKKKYRSIFIWNISTFHLGPFFQMSTQFLFWPSSRCLEIFFFCLIFLNDVLFSLIVTT